MAHERIGGQLDRKAGRISAEASLKLWNEYRRSGDLRLRDRLVFTLAPIVKYIVYRKIRQLPPHLDVDDFISCGLEALIRSIDGYDPDKGTTLEQHAWIRIHGAVLDELRRNDWAPRSLRRWERDIRRVRTEFRAVHGRAPRSDELADALGISAAALTEYLGGISRSKVQSLNTTAPGEHEFADELIATLVSTNPETQPESCAIREDNEDRFRQALERLPVRDRQVAVLHYVNDLTLSEVADVLGLTSSRVSQIHSDLKQRFKKLLVTGDRHPSGVSAGS